MNILEDLWFGNISPWERPFRKDGAYAELLALVVRHQEDLLACFDNALIERHIQLPI